MSESSNSGNLVTPNRVSSENDVEHAAVFIGRKASEVWNYFEKVEITKNGEVLLKAKCLVCGDLLARGGNNGTHSLKRHAEKHKKFAMANADIRTQMQLGLSASGTLSNFKFDKMKARKAVAEFIVRAELPFTFVEKHDFTGLIQRFFQPQYSGFSASTCQREVLKIFSASKTELQNFFSGFKGKVCLTSDVWSSRQKLGYLSLTAHYIDNDWLLNKRILSFKMIDYPHSGESLAQHINEELIAWRIQDKIFSITLDNASNNDSLVNVLPDYLMLSEIPRQMFHIRCCAHILNLIVQDGLSVLSGSVDKISTIVRNMNTSNKRHEIWVNACKDLGLSKKNIDIDVPHRWNSTHDMLVTAIKYKAALHRYVMIVNESRNVNLEIPNETDWLLASLVCNFLSIFNSSTKICCGIYTPTSSRVILCLVEIYQCFIAFSEYAAFKDALRAMKLKFDKYWSTFPMVFCLATIMDPRFKLFAIEDWLKCYGLTDAEVATRVDSIKTCLYNTYDYYKRQVTPATFAPVTSSSQSASDPIKSVDSAPHASFPLVKNFCISRMKKARVSSNTSSHASDLQMYLDLATIEVDDDNTFNLLGWWKANQAVYPVLSCLARDVLSVPASTVASEAAFSAGGRVVSEKRAALRPSTIEALVCLKDWSLADGRAQEAAREEEAIEEMMVCRPEWMDEESITNLENTNTTQAELNSSVNLSD